MRRPNTSTFLFAALLLIQPALAEEASDQASPAEVAAQPAAPQAASESASAAPAASVVPSDQPAEAPAQQRLTREEICQLIEQAASGEALPFEFFARLIWQESRFNPQAVSPAGAQGIAQFMPKTANGRGLANPFEPAAALQESAEFLRELRQQFGNLGLAAAAYNAGPKRVHDWLAKRSSLPRETQNYVQIITGHSPEKWAAAEPPSGEKTDSFQCNEIAKLVAERRSTSVLARLAGLVAQRLGLPRGEILAPRRSLRNGILAKRNSSPASPARSEQLAKAEAPPRGKSQIQKIIKITAQGHNRPRIQVVDVAVSPGRLTRGEKTSKVADQRGKTVEKASKVADQRSKTAEKTSKVADRQGKLTDKARKVAEQRGKPTENATKVAEQRPIAPAGKRGGDKSGRDMKLAGNDLGKAPRGAERAEKTTARSSPAGATHGHASAKIRVAANTHAGAEKSCGQAKGGARKSCRAA